MHEFIFLTAFGQLTGKVFGAVADKEFVQIATYQGKMVDLTYKDTGQTKYKNNKPRRIFELVKITPR